MPREPIVMASWALNLDQALPPEFNRRHVVVKGALRQWPNPPPGGSVYAVVDDAVLRALKIDAPHPAGLELVGRRNYSGLVDFSVLRYRPLRSAGSRSRESNR